MRSLLMLEYHRLVIELVCLQATRIVPVLLDLGFSASSLSLDIAPFYASLLPSDLCYGEVHELL